MLASFLSPQACYFPYMFFVSFKLMCLSIWPLDFHYLRLSSFVWRPKPIAHIQELDIKELMRGQKKEEELIRSSISRLDLLILGFTEGDLGLFVFFLWIFTVSSFRSLPLGSSNSSQNEISISYLENISVNASILGTKQGKMAGGLNIQVVNL